MSLLVDRAVAIMPSLASTPTAWRKFGARVRVAVPGPHPTSRWVSNCPPVDWWWAGWIAVRRQLGLWCFAYVVLHLSAYAVFILALDWSQLGVELRKRPYIIVGTLGFAGLLVLAVTSNRYSQRRLGSGWKKLHRLVYVILGLGLLHMLWIVRADLKEWAIYAFIGGLLLVLRIPPVTRRIPRLIAKKSSSATKA